MARVNFGRSPTVRGYNPMENTLKPGYIIKLRGKFYAVDSVEGLTYDLVVTAQETQMEQKCPTHMIADISKTKI